MPMRHSSSDLGGRRGPLFTDDSSAATGTIRQASTGSSTTASASAAPTAPAFASRMSRTVRRRVRGNLTTTDPALLHRRTRHAKIQGNKIVANGDEAILTEYGKTNNKITIDNNIITGNTFTGADGAWVKEVTNLHTDRSQSKHLIPLGLPVVRSRLRVRLSPVMKREGRLPGSASSPTNRSPRNRPRCVWVR